MKVFIESVIRIDEPTAQVESWIKENLKFRNPEYDTKMRMGKYVGNIPQFLTLYEKRGNSYIIPYGAGSHIQHLLQRGVISSKFARSDALKMKGSIPLYEYQKKAVKQLLRGRNGLLIAPCGSGKTQIGIALIKALGLKALWVTHTMDLLNQSKKRAEEYFEGDFGTITGGKVSIGNDITFATVQTLSNIDLPKYKDEWNVIVVDEAHKVVGGPTKVMMFYKVLSNLSARHKFGLSATYKPKGKSHISNTTQYIVGPIIHEITKREVDEKIIASHKEVVSLLTPFSEEYLNFDGTMIFNKLIDYLVFNTERNQEIVKLLRSNRTNYCLILSHRVEHLKILHEMLGEGEIIVGKTKKSIRKDLLEKAKNGEIHYLFSTYQLAKEGLDIPILDRLFMVTPQKDYTTVIQSVGRIERNIEGKDTPIVYDFVDINIPHLVGFYTKRKSHYRKAQ